MTVDIAHAAARMPCDLDAEQQVIGAMLLSPAAIAEVVTIVQAEDFYKPAHELIFQAVVGLDAEGQPTEPAAVAARLQLRQELGRAGGAVALADLVHACVTPANAAHYAAQVRERAVLRRLVQAGMRITQMGLGGGVTAGDATAAAVAEVAVVAEEAVTKPTARVFGDVVDEIFDRLDDPGDEDAGGGLTWGWVDVDRLLRPMRPGQLIIVGARPAVGKTTLCKDIAVHVAMNLRRRVVFHSLEVDAEAIEAGVVAGMSRVGLASVLDRRVTGPDWQRIARARERMEGAELVIDDGVPLNLAGVRSSIRRHKPDLVIVDQIQLMQADPGISKRNEQVAALSRGLKLLAKAEGIPIIAVSKVNRGPEQRVVKAPVMSDLKESGDLESDADVVALLHREDVSEPESPRAGELDVIVAKQRHGQTGTVTLASQLAYGRFSNLGQGWAA